MAFTFRDMREHAMKNAHTSTDFFGQLVTYRRADGSECQIAAVVEHKQKMEQTEHGHDVVVQQITVTINRSDLDPQPKLKDRIILQGETEAYLFSYRNETDPVSYVATFEQRNLPVVNSR